MHKGTIFTALGAVVFLGAAACGDGRALADSRALAPASAVSADSTQASAQKPRERASQSSAAPSGYRGPLPPIPFSPNAAAPAEVVSAVYEFAARHPEVMRHVPCFCGCERNGHQDNEDCFIAKRDPDGRPHWDVHGLTWKLCIDVARDAMQMHGEKRPITEIRATIDRTYGSRYPTQTPTPQPPAPKRK